MASGRNPTNTSPLENIAATFLRRSQQNTGVSQETSAEFTPDISLNLSSSGSEDCHNLLSDSASLVPTKKLLDSKLKKQKKAEKNARLIAELSTVIAFNPYAYRVASTGNTTAWRRAFEALVEEGVLENTVESRKSLMRDVLRCVKGYKTNCLMSTPDRELTEIETLARDIYQLQVKGAPPSGRALLKKLYENHSGDGVAMNVRVDICHGVDSEDVEQSGEEVPAGEIESKLLLVPSEQPGKDINLPFSSSGVKKLPIPRVASGITIPTEVQYFLLCPTPVTTHSLEQANPPASVRPAATERYEKEGHWRNCEAAAESDVEMAVEDDRQEYDNGLPTAIHLPSALPNAGDQEKRLSFEEAKENICEYIYCSTCGVSKEPCWIHAKFIKDRHSLPLALSSLPSMLRFKNDKKTGLPLGVKSRLFLQTHTVFGPLRGALCSYISTRFATYDSTTRKYYHLDSDDTCNWMKYVRFADSAQEQNLAVYTREGRIFFVTTREVKPKEELKVWYSREYADSFGFGKTDEFHGPEDVEDGLSEEHDEVYQNDDVGVALPEIEENEFRQLSFDESTVPDAGDDPEILTADSVEESISSRKTSRARRKFVNSVNERTDNEFGQEMIPIFDTTTLTEHVQLMNVPDLQSACDATSFGNIANNSAEVLPDNPEKSGHIRGSRRKKLKTGLLKKKLPRDPSLTIKFPCAECVVHFPTEEILLLHNYQHSDDRHGEERTCPECEVIFENLDDLSLHVREHGKKYYHREKCLHCDALVTNWFMNGHVRHYHAEKFDPTTGLYPCKKCGMEFITGTARSQHVTATHGTPLECMFCGKIAPSSVSLGRHVCLHKVDGGFRCPKCQKTFRNYSVLRVHHERHCHTKTRKKRKDAELPRIQKNNQKVSKFRIDPSTKIKFPCTICRKYYKLEALLEVHLRFHETESDKSYSGDDLEKACPECGEEFDTHDALFRHVEEHGVNFYEKEQCPICKKFITAHLFKKHMSGNHPSEEAESGEEYPCAVCQKVFPSKMKHQAHIQMHKLKKCLLCAEIFERWQDLGKHALNTHKQADGFHCPYCDAVFDTFRRLTSHHRNRHDIRSIVSCEICGKMCKNKGALHLHMDIDHGSKEFSRKCDLCGKMFRRESTLRSHVATMHTARGRKKVQDYQEQLIKRGYVAPKKRMLLDEFPFKCETCQVGFSYEGRMLRHMTRFHADDS